MSRELNKDLFQAPVSMGGEQKISSESFSSGFEVTEEDWRLLNAQIEPMKRRLKDLDTKVSGHQNRTEDLIRAAKGRIDRVATATQRLEEHSQLKFQDVSAKFSTLSGKVTERKLSEAKIEEMIVRHGQALQSFEVRTQQLQKLISEQQMQLMNYKSALADAQQEITRLKRK